MTNSLMCYDSNDISRVVQKYFEVVLAKWYKESAKEEVIDRLYKWITGNGDYSEIFRRCDTLRRMAWYEFVRPTPVIVYKMTPEGRRLVQEMHGQGIEAITQSLVKGVHYVESHIIPYKNILTASSDGKDSSDKPQATATKESRKRNITIKGKKPQIFKYFSY